MKKIMLVLLVMMFVLSGVVLADQTSGGSSVNTNTATATGNGGYIKDSGNSSVGNGIGNLSPSAKTEVDVKNTNISSNANISKNINKQAQGQLQGQLQGQVANGKVSTDVKVEGDTIKSTAIAFPSLSSAEGVSSGTATYLFGSLGKSSTEVYKKIIPQIQTILAIPDDMMDKEMKSLRIKQLVNKMTDANRTQRVLGVLWEDNSKSILNVFGLLTWDSLWDEGQKPFQSKSDIK